MNFFLKDQSGKQSPTTTPRDYSTDSLNKSQPNATSSASSSSSFSSQNLFNKPNQQQQQVQAASSLTPKNNEKEILIQRVSSSSSSNQNEANSRKSIENSNLSSPSAQQQQQQQKLNYIDVQVLNKNKQQEQQLNNSPLLNKSDNSHLINKQSKPKPNIPTFYFPSGKPHERQFKGVDDLENMKLIQAKFKSSKDGKILREDFGDIVKMLDLPRYWKSLLFRECTLNSKINYVTYPILEQVWSK